MKSVNIAPLLIDHKEPYCQELAALERQGIISETAFLLKLNPEGTPPVDSASHGARQFSSMRDELRKYSSMPVGILIQAFIGHGYWLDTPPTNFQHMVGLPPENPDDIAPSIIRLDRIVCPLDPGFLEYMAATARTLASTKPDFLLIEDDYRMFSLRNSCFCPLHIAEYNRRFNGNYTLESLSDAIRKSPEISLHYEHFVGDTFADGLRRFRAALDSAGCKSTAYYCMGTAELKYAPHFAKILASEGAEPVVRLNNGRYLSETMRNFPGAMYLTALAVSSLRRHGVPVVLSEPDTFPHNQYSTSAALLNCHQAGSFLEGCNGEIHWLKRIGGVYEPESGLAYQRILAEYTGFYQKTHELWQRKQDIGVVFALPGENFDDHRIYNGERPETVPGLVNCFPRLGVPANFSTISELPTILDSTLVNTFSDREITRILKNGAILDGASAFALSKRGFAHLLGCRVDVFGDEKVTHETLADGTPITPQPNGTLVRLIPLTPKTEVLSWLGTAQCQSAGSIEILAPGMTRFCNQAGGVIGIFAGSPFGGAWVSEFSFFNQSRKKVIFELLNSMHPLPVFYPGTDEFFCKLWQINGDIVMPFITLGHDDFSELELRVLEPPAQIEMLLPSGGWKQVAWRNESSQTIVIEQEFRASRPFVLRFTKARKVDK